MWSIPLYKLCFNGRNLNDKKRKEKFTLKSLQNGGFFLKWWGILKEAEREILTKILHQPGHRAKYGILSCMNSSGQFDTTYDEKLILFFYAKVKEFIFNYLQGSFLHWNQMRRKQDESKIRFKHGAVISWNHKPSCTPTKHHEVSPRNLTELQHHLTTVRNTDNKGRKVSS